MMLKKSSEKYVRDFSTFLVHYIVSTNNISIMLTWKSKILIICNFIAITMSDGMQSWVCSSSTCRLNNPTINLYMDVALVRVLKLLFFYRGKKKSVAVWSQTTVYTALNYASSFLCWSVQVMSARLKG